MAARSRNGRTYFYHSVRTGEKVRSKYLGTGDIGELVARIEEIRRDQAQYERWCARVDIARVNKRSKRLTVWCRLVQDVFEVAMAHRGYHRHERGPFRRTRVTTLQRQEAATPKPRRYSRAEIDKLIQRAHRGDREAAGRLRVILAANPKWLFHLVDLLGDAALEADELHARQIAGKVKVDGKRRTDEATALAVELKAAMLRRELAPPGSHAVEQLLAARIASC